MCGYFTAAFAPSAKRDRRGSFFAVCYNAAAQLSYSKKKIMLGAVLYWLLVSVRFLWNLSFLGLHPLVVVLVADLLDSKDAVFYIFTGQSDKILYDMVDKAADLVFYLSAFMFYFYFRKELWYARILAYAFLFRSVGNVIFLISVGTARWVPIAFPAVAMPWMLLYSFLDYGFRLRNYDQRWDGWLRSRPVVNVLVLLVILALWVTKEVLQWSDGNAGPPDDFCSTPVICMGLILPLFGVLILFGIYMGVDRAVHFNPGTVRYNAVPKRITTLHDVVT